MVRRNEATEPGPAKKMVGKAYVLGPQSQAKRLKKMVKKKYNEKKIGKNANEPKVSKQPTTKGKAQNKRIKVVKATSQGTKQENVF